MPTYSIAAGANDFNTPSLVSVVQELVNFSTWTTSAAFGFDQEEGDALVRTKLGRLREKFEPTEGGWLFYRYEDGVWNAVFHHVDVDTSLGFQQMKPDYVWPNEEIEKVYGAAVSARAKRAKR